MNKENPLATPGDGAIGSTGTNGKAPKGRSFANRFWLFVTSPVIFVVLSILWCLDLAVGSIMAYQRDSQFSMKMDSIPFNVWLENMAPAQLPHSAWVYILVALTWMVMISLLLCSIGWFMQRRARKRTMAEVLLHLGFMLVFVGFLIGSGWGQRAQNIDSFAGEVVAVDELGVALSLEGVELVRDDEGNELETISKIKLLDDAGELLVSGTARLNHPLIYGSTVVYPMGGGEMVSGALIDVGEWGEITVTTREPYKMPGGMEFRVKGTLQPGQRYQRWVGPGAFVTIGNEGGPDIAGDFVGQLGVLRRKKIGSFDVTWKEPVTEVSARFNVHRDPGVQLVLAGAVMLGLGTLWAMAGFLRRT